MKKYIVWSVVLLVVFGFLGYFVIHSERTGGKHAFRFGLDLIGGTELIYNADTSKTDDKSGAMESLKEVIERRVNVFGVSEPLIQTEKSGLVSGNATDRLIV